MATDIPAMKNKLIEEKDILVATNDLIDWPAEQALMNAAQAALDQAQRVFDKKSERWTLINDKKQRLEVLETQIALFT